MKVYECDRCGRYVEAQSAFDFMGPRPFMWRIGFSGKRHICGDCFESFKRWWDAGDGAGDETMNERKGKE